MDKENNPVFKLYSKAFKDGQAIPDAYSSTKKGKNISPPFYWINVPDKTESLVLMQEDIDTPWLFSAFIGKIIIHWIMYNIPSNKRELKEGIPVKKILNDGSIQAKNIFRQNGYLGPNPIWGMHRYRFTLYALDIIVNSQKILNKNKLVKFMKGHILAQAQIMGFYTKE